MLDVKISGVSYQVYVDDFYIQDDLNRRSVAAFTVHDPGSAYAFQRGQPILVYIDGDLLFSGFIDSVQVSKQGGGTKHQIKCMDMHYLADKRVLAKSYTNQTASYIINDIVDTILTDEGVVANPEPVNIVEDTTAEFATGTLNGVTATGNVLKLIDTSAGNQSHTDNETAEFEEGDFVDTLAESNYVRLERSGADYSATRTTTTHFNAGTYSTMNSTDVADQLQLNKTNINGYSYRAQIPVNGTADGTQSNYSMKLTVYKGSGTNSAGVLYLGSLAQSWTGTVPNDLRFYSNSTCTTALDYWIEYSDASSAIIWIEISSIPTGGTNIYALTGKSSDTTTSNGVNTFLVFDHFDDSSVDTTTRWNINAAGGTSYSESGSSLTLTGGSSSSISLSSKNTYLPSGSNGYAFRSRGHVSSDINYLDWGFKITGAAGCIDACHDNAQQWRSYSSSNNYVSRSNALTSDQTIEIHWHSSSLGQFYLNDTYDAQVTTQIPTSAMNAHMEVWGSHSLVLDWTLVRKLTTNEPTFGTPATPVQLYVASGSWTSGSTSIEAVGNAVSSSISWSVTANGATVNVQASVDGTNYYNQTSGQTIVINGTNINNGYSCAGKSLTVKVVVSSGTGAATPVIDAIATSINSAYITSGTWTSPTIPFNINSDVSSSSISWTTAGTGTITVQTRVGGGTWRNATSGNSIQDVVNDMGSTTIEYKATFSGAVSTTPQLTGITAAVNLNPNYSPTSGTRIEQIDVSDAGLVDASTISWTTGGTGTVTIEASTDGINYYTCTSDEAIPVLTQGVTYSTLYVRTSLSTASNSVTPTITSFAVNITGLNTIATGITLTEAVFNYVSCAKAIDSIANKCGYWWCISANGVLYFQPNTAYESGWGSLDITNLKNGTFKVSSKNPNYRNRQILKGGTAITTTQTQNLKADGTTKSWTVGYPLAEAPTITVNSVSKTVGVKGKDTSKDFYWQKGDSTIAQEVTQNAYTTETISVSYKGEYPLVAITQDNDETYRRQQIEGIGTGIVESVYTDRSLTNATSLMQVANSMLGSYSKGDVVMSFETRKPGLYAGETVVVDLPDYGIDTTLLINSVKTTIRGGMPMYTANLAETAQQSMDWAKALIGGDEAVIRENAAKDEVTMATNSTTETWTWTENVTQTITPAFYPSDTTYPDTTLYPT